MQQQQQTVYVKGPILTLKYNGGAPQPHQACTEPTPDEEYQMHENNRAVVNQQKEMQLKQPEPVQQQPSGGGGLFAKLGKAASVIATKIETTASDIHAGAEKQVRAQVWQRNQDRFTREFPEIAQSGEQLICDYSCKVMHQGVKVSGSMQITQHFLLFTSDELKDVIPLNEIASIQRSIELETIDNGPPFIMPIPAPHVVADTLQIFTVRMQVYQFLNFESPFSKASQLLTSTLKGKAIDRTYNFLDHAWRAATPVPIQGFQYAPY